MDDGFLALSVMAPNTAGIMASSWESSRLRPRRGGSERADSAAEAPARSPLTSPRPSPANTPSPRLYLPVSESAARELRRQASAHADLERLMHFLETVTHDCGHMARGGRPREPGTVLRRFHLYGESIACVYWQRQFFITGTDIVRALLWRFRLANVPIEHRKKFEEGVFSDLRNLKPGAGAVLEEARSKFLDMLYKHNCIRTHKKQKVFVWDAVPHDRLFIDSLRREQQRRGIDVADDDTLLIASVRSPTAGAAPPRAASKVAHDSDPEWLPGTPPRKRPLPASEPTSAPPSKRGSPILAAAAIGTLERTLSDSSSIDLLVTAVEVAELERAGSPHGSAAASPAKGKHRGVHHHRRHHHHPHDVDDDHHGHYDEAAPGDENDDDFFYADDLGSDEIVEDSDVGDENDDENDVDPRSLSSALASASWGSLSCSAPSTPCGSGGDRPASPNRPPTPRAVVPPC